MKIKCIGIFFLFFTLNSQSYLWADSSEKPDGIQNLFQSVVLIKNETFLTDSTTKPWIRESLSTGYGTGVVINGNKILTNAHVVKDSKYITVKHFNKKKIYKARIKFIAMDCDLALLEVEDNDFYNDITPLSIKNGFPGLGSELLILGYPNGSENLSVEKGNVISIEKSRYSFSGLDIRNVIKFKADIVPGNSGGPAIKNGELVGLVFQISQMKRNIAYLIPTDIINHFLEDIKDGKYDGFPQIGFSFQPGDNPALKEYYKIPENSQGILLNTIYPDSTFFDYLKPGDYLYKIDDFYINGEGELISDKKIMIIDYVEKKFINDPVTLYFYRDGKKYKATASLKTVGSLDLYREENIDYFLNSGLVFQPVSKIFFSKSEPGITDSGLKYHFSYFIQDELYKYNERDIVLGYVFDDPENFRYKDYKFKIVETINGYTPRSLEHFSNLWKKYHSETIVIKFRGVDLPIVITPINRKKINTRIQKKFGVENNDPF